LIKIIRIRKFVINFNKKPKLGLKLSNPWVNNLNIRLDSELLFYFKMFESSINFIESYQVSIAKHADGGGGFADRQFSRKVFGAEKDFCSTKFGRSNNLERRSAV
jgi:hypothetical protein